MLMLIVNNNLKKQQLSYLTARKKDENIHKSSSSSTLFTKGHSSLHELPAMTTATLASVQMSTIFTSAHKSLRLKQQWLHTAFHPSSRQRLPQDTRVFTKFQLL